MDDDFRVDFIKHPGDLILIQNVQLHHIWSSDAMQTSADRLPAIYQELSLHLTAEQTTSFALGSASSNTFVEAIYHR